MKKAPVVANSCSAAELAVKCWSFSISATCAAAALGAFPCRENDELRASLLRRASIAHVAGALAVLAAGGVRPVLMLTFDPTP